MHVLFNKIFGLHNIFLELRNDIRNTKKTVLMQIKLWNISIKTKTSKQTHQSKSRTALCIPTTGLSD